MVERWFEEALGWVDRRREESPEWSEAAVLGDRMLSVTPAELEELNRRIGELLDPYVKRLGDQREQPPGSRPVTFIQLGFPIADEPGPR